jgi:tetratricopeptide (TPR) repeat protein
MKKMAGSMMILLVAASGVFPRDRSNDIIVFKNVNLISMTSAKVIPHQTVLIKGNTIFKIGNSKSLSTPKGAIIVDGNGKYLMPGLADMHVHFGLREWETPDANLFLANGVTTIRDLTQGESVSSIKKWCVDFNSKNRLGPTIYDAWTIWGNESQVMATVPLIKTNGYDCLKVNDFLSRADFFNVLKKAKESGIYTLGHIAYPVTIDDVIASGMEELSHVELLPIALIHDPQFDSVAKEQWGDEMLKRMFGLLGPVHQDQSGSGLQKVKARLAAEIRKLQGKDVVVTTTLVCDQAMALMYNDLKRISERPDSCYLAPRFWDDLKNGKEKNSFFRGREWAAQLFYDLVLYSMDEIRKNRIPIVAGTDTGPVFMGIVPGFSLHDELQLLIDCGYAPYEALSAATRDASKIIAKMTGRDEFGTIEPGKRADLLLLENNPLSNIASARNPLGVMTAGVWLDKGKLNELLQIKRKLVTPILREVAKKTSSAEAVVAEYEKLVGTNRLNDYYMGEPVLTTLGYDFLKLVMIDEAIKIFKFNVGEYPYAANVYDSLGEAYLKKGDKSLAIENYRKALSMDPSFESSRNALRELEK